LIFVDKSWKKVKTIDRKNLSHAAVLHKTAAVSQTQMLIYLWESSSFRHFAHFL